MVVGGGGVGRGRRDGRHLWELEDPLGGRRSGVGLTTGLQGADLLEGDGLRGGRLGVGGGRLCLVPAGGTARAGAGTAGRASVQYDTTWRTREREGGTCSLS